MRGEQLPDGFAWYTATVAGVVHGDSGWGGTRRPNGFTWHTATVASVEHGDSGWGGTRRPMASRGARRKMARVAHGDSAFGWNTAKEEGSTLNTAFQWPPQVFCQEQSLPKVQGVPT
jgi:hypothetical protein